MTKLTRFANGLISNKPLNLLANAAGMAASALALTTTFAILTPNAEAYTTCHEIGGSTYCNGSSGSATFHDIGGSTYYSGRDNNGNYYGGSCHTIGGSTYCN